MPAAVRSFWQGLKLAVAYAALGAIMYYFEDYPSNPGYYWSSCLYIFAFQLVLAAVSLAFASPRQLRWYRWSLLLPMSVLWPLLMLSQVVSDVREIFFMTAAWVLPGAPLVWLLGALSIRCDDRRDRRLLGH
jgi:hypothetical protein